MTPPPLPPTEPVKSLVALGSLVSAAVVAVGGAATLIAAHRDLTAAAQAIGGAVTAVGALVAFAAPYVAALRARRLVTPLSRPRDANGTPLVPVTTIETRQRPPGPQTPGVPDHAAD